MPRWTTDDDVRVDLDGLPVRFSSGEGRHLARAMGAVGVLGVLQVVLQAAGGTVVSLPALLGLLQACVGAVALVDQRRTHVLLGGDGVRVTGWTHRRSSPWSRVREVRPPGRWAEHAEVRGTRASDRTVALAGMTAEQAEELQRRLELARAGAGAGGTS